jgi:hypothetical protein
VSIYLNIFILAGVRFGHGGGVKKNRITVSFLLIAAFLFLPGSGKLWAAAEETVDKSPSPGSRNPFAYPAKILKEMALAKKPEGKPGAEAPATAQTYTLTGILWTERGGVASINQRILREGESLDDYRVTRIESGKVVLKKNDEELVLNLFQSPMVITRHDDQFPIKRKR